MTARPGRRPGPARPPVQRMPGLVAGPATMYGAAAWHRSWSGG